MYCSSCGTKNDETSLYCSNCGKSLNNDISSTKEVNSNEGSSSFGWGVLGFFFPVVGLILYIVWKNDRPKDSKSAGTGALVSVIANIIIFIIAFALLFSFGFNEINNIVY